MARQDDDDDDQIKRNKVSNKRKTTYFFSFYKCRCKEELRVKINFLVFPGLFKVFKVIFSSSHWLFSGFWGPFQDQQMWHYVGHSLCWYVWVPVSESLFLLWRETHTKGLSTRSLARPEVDEGRKVLEKTKRVSWQRRAVRIWKQNREERTKVRKTTAKICWPTEAGLNNSRRQVSIASGFVRVFARVHARVSSQNAQKMSQTSPFLTLGANPSPCLFVCLFFSSILSVVFCISVKNVRYPRSEMRKTTWWITGHEWFKEAEIVESAGGYGHTRAVGITFTLMFRSFFQLWYSVQLTSLQLWVSIKAE